MKTLSVSLSFFFLTCFVSISFSQNSFLKTKNIYLEVSPFLGELQIKNNPFNESLSLGYGGAISFGISNKSYWGINVGVDFFAQEFFHHTSFTVNYSNPNNTAISFSDFRYENLENPISNYDVEFSLKFDGTNCENPDLPPVDGEMIKLRFQRANILQQIGIPIKMEKAIGKKKLKLYLGIGAKPIFFVRESKISRKYRNSGSIIVRDHRRRCYSGNSVLEQITVTEQNIILKNQNILNTRLDLTSEFGLLHEGIKNTFKMTLVYNQSITGYTQVDVIKYDARTVGLKLGLRKNIFKKKVNSRF